jgi:hypothetical protein
MLFILSLTYFIKFLHAQIYNSSTQKNIVEIIFKFNITVQFLPSLII